jgi:hypothetical protein
VDATRVLGTATGEEPGRAPCQPSPTNSQPVSPASPEQVSAPSKLWSLKARKKRLARWLATTHKKRRPPTRNELAQRLCVDPSVFSQWTSDPEIINYFLNRLRRTCLDHSHEVLRAVEKSLEEPKRSRISAARLIIDVGLLFGKPGTDHQDTPPTLEELLNSGIQKDLLLKYLDSTADVLDMLINCATRGCLFQETRRSSGMCDFPGAPKHLSRDGRFCSK